MRIHLDFLFLLMLSRQIGLLTFFILALETCLFAQVKVFQPIPNKDLLQGDGAFISTYDSTINKFWGYQIVLLNGRRTAVRLAGGAVFDLDSFPNRWARLDSSSFVGYNNGALTFSRNGTLYKYGGYGFWMNHGLLLKLKNCQWEFEHQNQEVKSFGNNSSFFHAPSHQIFSFSRPTKDQSFSDEYSKVDYAVFSMDVDVKEWRYLGHLQKEFQQDGFQIFLKSPNGFLAMLNGGSFVFLNVEDRKAYYLNQKMQSKMIDIFRWKEKYQILQSKTGWVLFPSNFEMNQKPIPYLSFREFEQNLLEGPVFYEKPINIWSMVIGAILATMVSFFAYLHQKLCQEQKKRVYHEGLPYPLDEIPFDEKETQLLDWLHQQLKNKPQVSVIEMNAILGIEGKSLDHQKKIRSELIKSINNKYLAATGKTELIQRKSNPLDKRLVDYGLTSTF